MYLNRFLFWTNVGFVLGMLTDLLVMTLSANQQPKISLEADDFTNQVISAVHMLRGQLEDAWTWMIGEANESRCQYDTKEWDSAFLDTSLLLIGYASFTTSESANINSRMLLYPVCAPFRLTEAISANRFRLNTPAHWKMHNVYKVSHLQRDWVEYGREHPPPAPLLHVRTDKDPV